MENINNGFSGVVSGKMQVEWRTVPDYSNYQASSTGIIRKIINYECFSYPKIKERKTSVGTYLNVYVINDKGKGKDIGVHVLVCKAFYKLPDLIKVYEPNHIDGNKHNNCSDNLEWLTRSDNCLHALKTGLRRDNVPVEVFDVINDTSKYYYSLAELAREWRQPRYNIKNIIFSNLNTLYQERWKFKIDVSRFGVIDRHTFNDLKAFDYTNNKIIIAENASQMQIHTGVKSSTILTRTGQGINKIKNKDQLTNGFVFKLLSDDSAFPIFPKEEIEKSKLEYEKYVFKDRKIPYTVKDYLNNTVKNYISLKEACKYEKLDYSKALRTIKKGYTFFRGKAIKLTEDKTEWPIYSKEYVIHSINSRIPKHPPLQVIDTLLNTTKLYSTKTEFAKEFNINPNKVTVIINRLKNKLYLDRYKLTTINIS